MECNDTELIPKLEPSDKIVIDVEIPSHLLEYLNSDDFNIHNLCRLCLTVSDDMTSLLSAKAFGVLRDMLSTFTSVQVHADDGLPLYVCELCKTQVINCFDFKMKCETSDWTLRKLLKEEINIKESTGYEIEIEDVEKNDLVNTKIKDEEKLSEDTANYENDHLLRAHTKGERKFELEKNTDQNYVVSNERCTKKHNEEIFCEGMQYLTTLNNADSDQETLCIVQNTGTQKKKKLKITITDTGSLLKPIGRHENTTLRSEKTYDCTICSKTFHKKKSFNNHLKQIHREEKNFSHFCEQCNEWFSSEHDLHLHTAIHSKGPLWTCNKCRKEFKGRSKLSRHIQRHMESKRYSCETCRKPFAELYALRRHQRVHTGEAIEKKHACQICNNRYASVALLSAHMARHSGGRECTCSDCGKTFASPRLLASHRLVHSDTKPYACIYCDRRFRHESTRNTHHRTHTGEKPYVCSACGKTFIQNSNLTLHMRVHTGEKPYSCSTCGRRFTSGSSLKNHQRTHTGEKPFGCTICGKRFARRDMRAHIRQHTGERPFACHICPKKFVNATRLRDHCRIHTGEKPFECDVCLQKFITKSYLIKHMNLHKKKKKVNKREVTLVREIDYNGSIILADKSQHISAEPDDNISNSNVLDTEETQLEVTGELVLQDDNEEKTEILVVDNSQNNVCLADGITIIKNDGTYEGEMNLVAVNEGGVSISTSSAMLEGTTVKLYQLDQSLVQIHSSGGQVTISKITSKMTANF